MSLTERIKAQQAAAVSNPSTPAAPVAPVAGQEAADPKAAADALAAAISGAQSLPEAMPSTEELQASYITQLAALYPEDSYLMQRQKVLLRKDGSRKLADTNGVISAETAEEKEVLAYWDSRDEGLVLKLK